MVNLCLVSLKHIDKKIKAFYHKYVESIIWVYIFILILVNSYILGFLSSFNSIDSDLLKIEYDPNIEITIDDLKTNLVKKVNSGKIHASKNGTKYYYDWCGSSRIKEENKIYFDSDNDAREEGYEISSSCK